MLLSFRLGLTPAIAVAAALTDGLSLAPVGLVSGSAAIPHFLPSLRPPWRPRRTPRPTARPALRHPFAAGSTSCPVRHSAAGPTVLRSACAGSSAGAHSTSAGSSASTHSAAATFAHALRRRQADAGEQHCRGQQEPT